MSFFGLLRLFGKSVRRSELNLKLGNPPKYVSAAVYARAVPHTVSDSESVDGTNIPFGITLSLAFPLKITEIVGTDLCDETRAYTFR